jgi:dihydropteroate synthase
MTNEVNLITLEKPIVMGILNATPDSFYQDNQGFSFHVVKEKANKMIEEGAMILDIGGMSTRPQSVEISLQEELNRVLPIIEAIRKAQPAIIISIDTYRSEVAQMAIEAGANMINDISGGYFDKKIISTAVNNNVSFVCMHMQGRPSSMQMNPTYNDVVQEVMIYFEERLSTFSKMGLKNVILDVGFGFGKSLSHNFDLLKNMSHYLTLGKPLLAGISRKSMIYKLLKTDAVNALNGTTALNMIALQQGAKILRVHDVKEAVECVQLYEMMR